MFRSPTAVKTAGMFSNYYREDKPAGFAYRINGNLRALPTIRGAKPSSRFPFLYFQFPAPACAPCSDDEAAGTLAQIFSFRNKEEINDEINN